MIKVMRRPASLPRCRALLIATVVGCGLLSPHLPCFAAVAKRPKAGNGHKLMAQISAALWGKDAAKQKWAIGKINEMLANQPGNFALKYQLANYWLRALARDGDYQVEVSIVTRCLIDNPGAMLFADKWQVARIQALLALGKTNAALRNAKSYFNFATTHATQQAMILLNQCLQLQTPNGPTLAREFRHEQMAGAQLPPPGQKPKKCAVLAGITVHGKAYAACARGIMGVNMAPLVARGNLWLLADRPDKALKCFKQAYDIATPQQLPMVCDRIAAAIRAKYGTIGPANAWLESIAR
jgi:tetratricopeptide (TPR) repeat protein